MIIVHESYRVDGYKPLPTTSSTSPRTLHLLLLINSLNNNRKILAKTENIHSVNPAVTTEPPMIFT